MAYARNKFSDRVSVIKETTGGRTQQHFKDQCDVNKIMARYRNTGVVDHVKRTRAIYGDFSQFDDFAGNMGRVAAASQGMIQMFEGFPATFRNKFRNDPVEFMNYIQDSKNFDECVQYGIFDPPKEAPKNELLDTLRVVAENTKPRKSRRPEEE